MSSDSVSSTWIIGPTQAGKTCRLLEQCGCQMESFSLTGGAATGALIFAATGDNRMLLADQVLKHSHGRFPFESTTPLAFFQKEVMLFYPLLRETLGLNHTFPLRLRPETEQELATTVWRPQLDAGQLALPGVTEYFVVRRMLDMWQLIAASGTALEDIPAILEAGFAQPEDTPLLWQEVGVALQQWRQWCLERGLLTYGLVMELYWRYLLPHPTYRQQLCRRYALVAADDVDEYPAIAHSLFTTLLDAGIPAIFTFNPNGAVRLGLGADPRALATLAERGSVETLESLPHHSLGSQWGTVIGQWVIEPGLLPELPPTIQVIQTPSRAQLLRETAEQIASAIHQGQIQAQEIAVIGPGLDAIARYTLREILNSKGIAVESLNDQQPLSSSPLVRALLTLMALVYPGLGRLLDREAVGEMLVILSQPPVLDTEQSGLERVGIDPVRAGLLIDHCFVPDPDHPHLLPATHFPRWDRLGYRASERYGDLVQWINTQQQQQQQRLLPSPVALLDRAIQHFLFGGSYLPVDRLAILRELMETAQHYWEVDTRLRQRDRLDHAPSLSVSRFIQLLRNGTITADPYPVRPDSLVHPAVTLATIFQYRSNRRFHRWHFWLDAGSSLWLTGGGPLFAAPLFLKTWSGQPWTALDEMVFDQQRLQRQLEDLLGRVGEQLYLCHSDLATNGQEQNGPLLTLINAATPVSTSVSHS